MRLIVGIDEVGRGCWAGPLVAAAVVLGKPITGLKDSKLLSKLQREKLAAQIQLEALAIGLGWIDSRQIDQIGLTKAIALAMAQAMSQIKVVYSEIIIDGHINFLPHEPKARAIIKADNSVPAVSAASIVAKVARDNYMHQIAKQFPKYGFDKHVGYGTKLHRDMLQLYGICRLHRVSYKPIQAILQASA